jgi:pilus assembly protein Flp/PilA
LGGDLRVFERVLQFLRSEDGPTAIEYAVMLALIVTVCITAVQAVGTNTNANFQKAAQQMQQAAS